MAMVRLFYIWFPLFWFSLCCKNSLFSCFFHFKLVLMSKRRHVGGVSVWKPIYDLKASPPDFQVHWHHIVLLAMLALIPAGPSSSCFACGFSCPAWPESRHVVVGEVLGTVAHTDCFNIDCFFGKALSCSLVALLVHWQTEGSRKEISYLDVTGGHGAKQIHWREADANSAISQFQDNNCQQWDLTVLLKASAGFTSSLELLSGPSKVKDRQS